MDIGRKDGCWCSSAETNEDSSNERGWAVMHIGWDTDGYSVVLQTLRDTQKKCLDTGAKKVDPSICKI